MIIENTGANKNMGNEIVKRAEISIKPNNNFHSATKTTVFDTRADERFLEYRRQWRENPERFIAADFPLHLDIESVAVCNLRCPFCATTNSRWGADKRGFMDLALYRKIYEETKN